MRLRLLIATVVSIVVAVAACGQQPTPIVPGTDGGDDGSGGGSATGGGSGGGGIGADGGTDSGTTIIPDCIGKTYDAGTHDWSLSHDAKTRTYRVHVPPNYDRSKKTPLVFNFHGYSQSGTEQERVSGLNSVADREGFIVIYADGLRGYETGLSASVLRSWNAGSCCAEGQYAATDDVGFVTRVLSTVEDRFCIDNKRVYSTGFSNGGFLSHRLACEMSDRFAAIGPVAGVNGMSPCNPTRPVPVMHFHGSKDNVVPYNGNTTGFISVRTSMNDWAQRNGCGSTPAVLSTRGDVTCESYPSCSAGADSVLCSVSDGGHQWPGGEDIFLGYRTMAVNASEDLWQFFKSHPMP